uniref:Myosin-Vb n=1 Tax=Cajanus cajan TaxID=3821 RepID=A0A151S8N3_CAJCA|nr:Myosin-Vb [Cajanus cajan]
MQGIPENIVVGSHVWVGDPELVWVDGQVLNINGEEAEIQTSNEKKVVSLVSKLYPKDVDVPTDGVDDMTKLAYLHEPGVLHNLETRYMMNEIYTYTGNILIAINPFQSLSHLYDTDVMQRYKGATIADLSPHVFAIAEAAYRAMINEEKSNCILVSGESGAGKTETTKMLMRYLAYLGGNAASEGRTVEQQVLEVRRLSNSRLWLLLLRYLNLQEISKFTKVFCLKVMAKMLFYLRNAMMITASKNNIINIHYQVDAPSSGMLIKNKMIRCDPVALEGALLERVMVTPEEIIKRSLDPLGAAVSRDGLAKMLYSRLFDWLVHKINSSIGQDPSSKCLIGVLDIYGFESFQTNSMFPKSTHETFAQKLYQTFKDHKRFIKPKLARSDFTVVHYAGEVQYQSEQFLDKNKDYVVPEHQDMLSASKCSFVSGLFPSLSEETAKSAKFSSIGSRFKLQLQQLMDTLNLTEPHYIRCVKPNSQLKSCLFENLNVIQQLRSGGVLEAVRIKCAGFPTHWTFHDFLTRLRVLAPEVLRGNFDEKDSCKMILEKMGMTGYQIGETKIFLRAGQMAELDAQRALLLSNSATVIQKHAKTRFSRQTYIALQKSSVFLQSICRGVLARRLYYHMRRGTAAVRIQKHMRRSLARKSYTEVTSSAIVLQTGFRTRAACDNLRYRKQTRASITIQSYWRRHKALFEYKNLKKASIISQNIDHSNDTHEEKVLETPMQNESPMEESSYPVQEESSNHVQEESSNHVQEESSNPVQEESSSPFQDDESIEVIRDSSSPLHDTEKIEVLNVEIKNLKVKLHTEKQRGDEYERKYVEAQGSSEELRKKLAETEKRVYQLQDSLNSGQDLPYNRNHTLLGLNGHYVCIRMISSMSTQVAELKMILSTSSRLSSTFRPIARVDIASSNSDTSSTDSDFTFPATASNEAPSSPEPNSFKLVVQDVTAVDGSG